MAKSTFSSRIFSFVLTGFLLLFACAYCAGPQSSHKAEVPEAKQEKWGAIQSMLQREHDVCKEHCGGAEGCLIKCEKAYNSRLDKKYQEILHESDTPSPEERWGVESQGISLTAADHLMVFRYRVVDPDKASGLMIRKDIPYFIHQATGQKVPVFRAAKVGRMQQTGTKPKADRVYSVLFNNPGKLVKPGQKVTVVIGNFKIEDMIVQ
jgi:hypothetical protein